MNSPSGGSRINQVNVRELGDLVSTLTGHQRTLATTAVANNNLGAPDPNSSAVVLPRLAGRRATPVDTKGVRSLSLGDKARRCTNCGNESTVGKKFCATSDSALPRRCSKCESKNAPTSAFCEDCGAARVTRHWGRSRRLSGLIGLQRLSRITFYEPFKQRVEASFLCLD